MVADVFEKPHRQRHFKERSMPRFTSQKLDSCLQASDELIVDKISDKNFFFLTYYFWHLIFQKQEQTLSAKKLSFLTFRQCLLRDAWQAKPDCVCLDLPSKCTKKGNYGKSLHYHERKSKPKILPDTIAHIGDTLLVQ